MFETAPATCAPLTLFSPSPTNPRQRITPTSIAEIAESIAPIGVKQAILARLKAAPAPGEPPMEIVFGERRWRACGLLTEQGRNPHGDGIPYTLEQLSDAEVLALQLIENIAREDLHPLDEAAHYERMRTQPEAPATIEQIAHLAKVDPARVKERLQLLHLVPKAQEVFLAGKLYPKTALYVASMPAHVQAELTEHLANWGGEPMGPKAAAQFIRERYTLRLAQAPFKPDDATLLAEAGACTACPKRSGANPQLFVDITEHDTCTDSTCFGQKKAAQRERLVDELRTTGYRVLQGDAARDACTPDGRHLKPGMHLLEDQVPVLLGDASLKIVDVLTRAQAPNEATSVVDHPAGAVLVYAVTTAILEGALRKIKAHRTQLDAAKKKAATKAAKPAPAPSPQSRLDDSPAPAAAAAKPATPETPAADPVDDQLLEELCQFDVPATSGGKYGYESAKEFAAKRERRIAAILTAARVSHHMRHDQAEGLPSEGLAPLIIVVLLYGDMYLDLEQVARLCRLQEAGPVPKDLLQKFDWAWSLEPEEANRVAAVMLALQESSGKDGLDVFPEKVAELLGADVLDVEDRAERIVADRLRLAALQHGSASRPAKKAAAKTPAAKKAPAKKKAGAK